MINKIEAICGVADLSLRSMLLPQLLWDPVGFWNKGLFLVCVSILSIGVICELDNCRLPPL